MFFYAADAIEANERNEIQTQMPRRRWFEANTRRILSLWKKRTGKEEKETELKDKEREKEREEMGKEKERKRRRDEKKSTAAF